MDAGINHSLLMWGQWCYCRRLTLQPLLIQWILCRVWNVEVFRSNYWKGNMACLRVIVGGSLLSTHCASLGSSRLRPGGLFCAVRKGRLPTGLGCGCMPPRRPPSVRRLTSIAEEAPTACSGVQRESRGIHSRPSAWRCTSTCMLLMPGGPWNFCTQQTAIKPCWWPEKSCRHSKNPSKIKSEGSPSYSKPIFKGLRKLGPATRDWSRGLRRVHVNWNQLSETSSDVYCPEKPIFYRLGMTLER